MKDLFSIAGKVALVTGGSRGIDPMIARGFVDAGARVDISSRKKDTDAAAAELSAAGFCRWLAADISTDAGTRARRRVRRRRAAAVGSIDGLQAPLLETYAYAASKAAVHQLTRHLAQQLAPRGIAVKAIAPGPFPSKMMAVTLERFGDAISPPARSDGSASARRHGGVAIYLASRAART